MMLTGTADLDFSLDAVVTTTTDVFLKPFCTSKVYARNDSKDAMSKAGHWTRRDVLNAATWWRNVANGTEPQDVRHVWFPGGIAFGRVHPHDGADVGIDIIVMNDHDADEPCIDYDIDGRGHVSVDDADLYITIDTTTTTVNKVADWWQRLALPMRNS